MGFQNSNDISGMEENTKTQVKSENKTSNIEKLSNDTSKCQYDRLTGSGRPVGTNGPVVGTGTI